MKNIYLKVFLVLVGLLFVVSLALAIYFLLNKDELQNADLKDSNNQIELPNNDNNQQEPTDKTNPELGIPFDLKINEEKIVSGTKIKFIEVVEDSRCPKPASCEEAGSAKVKIEVTDGTKSLGFFEVATGKDGQKEIKREKDSLTIKLTDLKPEREIGKQPSNKDYTSTFVVDLVKN